MKYEINVPQKRVAKTAVISAPINYGDEEIPMDFPCRKGENFEMRVDIDTGKIEGWPDGKSHKMFMTVKDSGTYIILDDHGFTSLELVQEYVPHGLIPGNYGDTIELDIGPDGVIKNWPKFPSLGKFLGEGEE